MRVTDLTKQNAVLNNVQRTSERVQQLQDNMASGKRINKLSDDPVGAAQVQDYRTKLSFFDTIRHNVKQNFVWLDRTETELSHMAELLGRTKSLVLQQINETSDPSSRRVTAVELQDMTRALINSGNTKIGKVHLFSGSRTLTPPLETNDAVQPARVSTENLADDLKFLVETEPFEQARFEGYSTNEYVVRIAESGPMGRAHYVVSDDGGETWSEEKTLLPEIEVINEEGKPSEQVYLHLEGATEDKLGEPLIFPQGLEFRFEPNPPVAYVGNDDKREITTGEGVKHDLNVTAKEVLFKTEDDEESLDIFGLMQTLQRALQNDNTSALRDHLDDLDRAREQVLNHQADVGALSRELQDRLDQIADRELANTEEMSQTEDLDYAEATVDMNSADARYRATLETSSRLIQPSLLNFLR